MNAQTAKEIAGLACATGLHIDAVMLLRREIPMGFQEAKTYLEKGALEGEVALFEKLCKEFVQDKNDLIRIARIEIDRLTRYIQQLEREIDMERENGDGSPAI
jgi:hypothetical protein